MPFFPINFLYSIKYFFVLRTVSGFCCCLLDEQIRKIMSVLHPITFVSALANPLTFSHSPKYLLLNIIICVTNTFHPLLPFYSIGTNMNMKTWFLPPSLNAGHDSYHSFNDCPLKQFFLVSHVSSFLLILIECLFTFLLKCSSSTYYFWWYLCVLNYIITWQHFLLSIMYSIQLFNVNVIKKNK